MGSHSGRGPGTSYSLWDVTPHEVVYTSAMQAAPAGIGYSITTGDPMALAPQARRVIAAIDPVLPLDVVETYQGRMNDNMTGLMYAAAMLIIDGLIALLLAAVGIFGVMANVVGERTREIGVRLAMGASREDVMRTILRRASWLTGTGLALGLAAAFVLARLLANLLRGVQPHDAVVFTSISVAIVLWRWRRAGFRHGARPPSIPWKHCARSRHTLEKRDVPIPRIVNLVLAVRVDREIAAELDAHLDLRIEDNIARGMTPEEARREALVRFGNRVTRERVAADDALGWRGWRAMCVMGYASCGARRDLR